MTQEEQDLKTIEEINASPIGMKFAFLHHLYKGAVRFKYHDEIYQTDGNPVEVTNPEYLRLLGKLLKEFADNDGKINTEGL